MGEKQMVMGVEDTNASGSCKVESRPLSQQDFLRHLFGTFHELGIRYVVLHSWIGLPDAPLASDLDLAVDPEDRARLPQVWLELERAGYCAVQCVNYAVNASLFVFLWIEEQSARCISVDVCFDFRAHALKIATGNELTTAPVNVGVCLVANAEAEFLYLLAKKAEKRHVSIAQAGRLHCLVQELGLDSANRIAQRLFGRTCGRQIIEACLSGQFGDDLLSVADQAMWRRCAIFHPALAAGWLCQNAIRLAKRWLRPEGLCLAVLGCDGVGKSTLVNSVENVLTPAFRGVRTFHWRPAILRNNGLAPVTDPQAKTPRSTLISMLFLCGIWFDCQLGYLLKVRQLMSRAGLVVFDRYFHDVNVDPLRYRYGGPAWFARFLTRMVPQPQLFIVLHAPTAMVHVRKQELEYEELERQQHQYRELALHYRPTLMLSTDRPVMHTTGEVVATIARMLRDRLGRRHASQFSM